MFLWYNLCLMSRDTRLNRTIDRALERRLQREIGTPQQTDRPFSMLLKTLLFLIGVPGVLVGILSLLPRMSVSVQDVLDKNDPFSAPFLITDSVTHSAPRFERP